tara:strand:- start:835 stop:1020 length:186 start_codon:yes stop_codon:yes gene_type:complete
MQLRLRPRGRSAFPASKHIVKLVIFLLIFFLAIFLLDKIDMPKPTKYIKQEISNDKLITVK